MKFKVSQTKLSELLNHVGKFASVNSPVMALNGIKLDVAKDKITLTASNAVSSVIVSAKASKDFVLEVEEEGSIVINKNYLTEIVKKIDSYEVSFDSNGNNRVTISGNKAEFSINGLEGKEYPLINFDKPEMKVEIEAAKLKTLVNKSAFACAVQEARPILTGVNLVCGNRELKATATDSYRLSTVKMPIDTDVEFNTVIPAKELVNIVKSFADDEKVTIAVDEKKAQLYNDRMMTQVRLVEGTYPNTDRFFPAEYPTTIVVDRKAFLTAVNRSRFIKSENDAWAIMELEIGADELILSSNSKEIGCSKESLSFKDKEGTELKLYFNSKYMSEALGCLEGDEVKIALAGQVKPFVLTSAEDEGNSQLILPVRAFH